MVFLPTKRRGLISGTKSATLRGRKWRLDTAIAILWPIEPDCDKIVARDDGCLDQ